MTSPEVKGHTPGPWHVVPYGDGDSLVVCSDEGGEWRICFMATHGGTEAVWRQIQANAALIAAAPDLLAALRKIADGDGIGGPDAELQCADIARAAISRTGAS